MLKQAMIKMAASSTCPTRPNRALASRVRVSAPVSQPGERGPRNAADVGEHGVDHRKQPGGEEPGPDGAPAHLPGFGHTEGLDVQRNDRPEIQPGQSVHGLVAVQDALHGGQGGVGGGRGAVACCCRVEQTARKQQQDQGPARRGRGSCPAAGSASPGAGPPERPLQKTGGSSPTAARCFPRQRLQHRKRGAGRAGDGEAWPNGEIYQNGEDLRKPGGAPARPAGAVPGPGYGHHACNGQADGADGKPGKGQPEAGACLCPQIGRKDQIACSKKTWKRG